MIDLIFNIRTLNILLVLLVLFLALVIFFIKSKTFNSGSKKSTTREEM